VSTIIATYNPKDGVGKTTTAVNVATVLARMGKSVLLVDLEADMNASISLGVRPSDAQPSIADLLLDSRRPVDAVRSVPTVENLHLITGSPLLATADEALRHVRHPDRRLADVLHPFVSRFEIIVLDCPPGYSLLPASVPETADHLLVPIRADYLSLESLAHFLRWYRDRRRARKARAHVVGILLTMVDYRRPATSEIVDIIRVHNRRGVFRTEIPDDPRAVEAPSHGIPLVVYARTRASAAYDRLTRELLARIRRRR
jgi:chromosome partitioning protein